MTCLSADIEILALAEGVIYFFTVAHLHNYNQYLYFPFKTLEECWFFSLPAMTLSVGLSGFSSLRCTSAGFQAARICSNHPLFGKHKVEAQVWINSLATPSLKDRDREIRKIVLSWWGFRLVWLEGTFLSTREILSVIKEFITWYTNYIRVGGSLCS